MKNRRPRELDTRRYYDRPAAVLSWTDEGEIGEQVACAQLQHIFLGHVVRFQGKADKGLDLVFTGMSPCHQKPLLHFVAQVKTGQSQVVRLGDIIKAKRVNAKRLLEWKRLEAPVLFLWVNPCNSIIHWSLVNKDNRSGSIFLSRSRFLCPATPYDFIVMLNRQRTPSSPSINGNELRPPSRIVLKDYALDYYAKNLLRTMIENPIVGDVAFTWAGWRHMVRRRHTQAETNRSLALLPLASAVLEDPSAISNFRRIGRNARGKITTESRLIAFRRERVTIIGRAPANIVVVVRERLVYPTNWRSVFHYQDKMIRDLTFCSIYEETDEKRLRAR